MQLKLESFSRETIDICISMCETTCLHATECVRGCDGIACAAGNKRIDSESARRETDRPVMRKIIRFRSIGASLIRYIKKKLETSHACGWSYLFTTLRSHIHLICFLFTNLGNDWSQTWKFTLKVFHVSAHKPHRSQSHKSQRLPNKTHICFCQRWPKLNPHKTYFRVTCEVEVRDLNTSIRFHRASNELCTIKFQP